MNKASFIIIGKKDNKEVVLDEKEVVELAIKSAEDLFFTKGFKELRIAQVVMNLSVEGT